MLARFRSRLTFANVVSLMALFVALSGGAYALTIPKNSVGAKQLKKNAVTGSKIKRSAVTSLHVKDGSLLSADFKAGQLATGAQGATGPPGAQGVQGPKGDKGDKGDTGQNGTPGTARAYGLVFGTICSGSPTAFCRIDTPSQGVSYAAHVGTGIYCVGVSGITSLSGVAIVSSSGDAPFVTWSANIACSTNEFEVRTYNASHTLSDQWFVITIP